MSLFLPTAKKFGRDVNKISFRNMLPNGPRPWRILRPRWRNSKTANCNETKPLFRNRSNCDFWVLDLQTKRLETSERYKRKQRKRIGFRGCHCKDNLWEKGNVRGGIVPWQQSQISVQSIGKKSSRACKLCFCYSLRRFNKVETNLIWSLNRYTNRWTLSVTKRTLLTLLEQQCSPAPTIEKTNSIGT